MRNDNRAQQEIAIARREAARIEAGRDQRAKERNVRLGELVIDSLGRRGGLGDVPVNSSILTQLLTRYRVTENLREAVAKAVARTGLEPVEAAKLAECHELLVEVLR